MGKNNNSLQEYKSKRDFSKTAEPKAKKKSKSDKPIFVIQKHNATSLHYDFRIEDNGELISWAVPKGPSTKTSEKRFATRTENHPVDYADFEGVIPEEEYGSGPVIVWDKGHYRNIRAEKKEGKTIQESLEEGKVEVWLEGEKIKGGYVLVVMGEKKENKWLMIKMDDKESDARRNPQSSEPESVKSGKTIEEIEQGNK